MTDSVRGRVAIVGIGHTAQGEHPGCSPELLSVRAIKAALADAGVEREQLDGLITCKSIQGLNVDTSVGPLLGIEPAYSQTLEYGTCNFSLHLACQAIISGMANMITLCYGSNARSVRFPFGEAVGGGLEVPSGLMHIAGPAALALQRHRAIYRTTEEQFAWIALSQRQWAQKNPLAIFREPLDLETYLASPYIVEPLRRADITMLSDGGVALVVTTPELAQNLQRPPIYIVGIAQQSAIRGERQPDYLMREALLKRTADRIWGNTGFRPSDVDVVYFQDPTAVWVSQMIENYGFCPLGEVGPWLAEGHTLPGGDKPINTNGGQLSESYMWGWLHIVEAVRQLRGEAGSRQVAGSNVALSASTQVWLKAAASMLATSPN